MAKKETAVTDSTESKDAATASQLTGFFQETQEELKKVVWPSRQQLIGESAAVILMVILVATVIATVDNLFSWLANQPFLFGGR